MSRLPDPTSTLQGKDKQIYDDLVSRRGRIDGMYRTLLNDPELTEHVSNLGTYLRFQATLPGDIRECAILYGAHRMNVPYEWEKHQEPAVTAGLGPDVIEAIRQNKPLPEPYCFAVLAAEHALALESIPEDLQNHIIHLWSVKGLLELVVLAGFYRMIAGIINAFDVQLPPKS